MHIKKLQEEMYKKSYYIGIMDQFLSPLCSFLNFL